MSIQWREPSNDKSRNLMIALLWIAAAWIIGGIAVIAGIVWLVMKLVG